MKALVKFQLNPKVDSFEGARLRKTIKSALELFEVPYTDTLMDDFDVAHFIYIEDDSVIEELNERHIPIVVSALYSEDDPCASYIEEKNKNGYRKYEIKAKAIKFLDKVDLVLVPNEAAEKILKDAGVSSRIEICPPGINFARFDFSRDDEKDIFYRYFNCDVDSKIAVAIGGCDEKLDGISVILNAAKVCEDVNFYYFAKSEHGFGTSRKVKKMVKKFPKNVFFSNLLTDDVYRSALLNADVFLHPGYRPNGIISLYEAMAAKCQLIVRKQDIMGDIIKDQETAYVASYSETLSGIIKDYFEGKIKPTYNKAYELISKYDIKAFGERIVGFYQELINKK